MLQAGHIRLLQLQLDLLRVEGRLYPLPSTQTLGGHERLFSAEVQWLVLTLDLGGPWRGDVEEVWMLLGGREAHVEEVRVQVGLHLH